MLELDMHLTEDELLALRDRRDDSVHRRQHLMSCRACKKRFAFLSAFKAALGGGSEDAFTSYPAGKQLDFRESRSRYSSSSFRSDENHPDTDLLAAYSHDALKSWVRSQVHEHVLGCERCMGDILAFSLDEAKMKAKPVLAARKYLQERGARVTYSPSSPEDIHPQLVLQMENGQGSQVLFHVLAGPGKLGLMEPGQANVDDKVEIIAMSSRVTITAHRDAEARYLDVQVRNLGRRKAPTTASVSLEERGKPLASAQTDELGTASIAVPPAAPEFDMRIDVGWVFPVLLRFRA